MNRKQLAGEITQYFRHKMPVAETELHYTNPFQLLVATILSAQCTDKRVNVITKKLFKHFPDPETMSAAPVTEIFELIKSCSYPNNKARHLKGMAEMLCRDFGGNVPDDTKQLTKLPGVGRKTANVVASVLYKKPVFAVDTHVFRVSRRIGLAKNAKNPLQAETMLTKAFSPEDIPDAHHWLILHGRYTCLARKPLCYQCGISHLCHYYAKNQKKISL